MLCVCTHAVRPLITFGDTGTVLGIVHYSITLSFTITNASPDVEPANAVWTFKAVGSPTILVKEQPGSRFKFSSDRRSLTITNLTHEDEGQYTITARNPAGSDNLAVNLAIEGKKNL